MTEGGEENIIKSMLLQVMVPFNYKQFVQDMTDLVKSGEVPIARVDDAVERILRVKFVAGLFEHPLADRSLLGTVGCKVRSLVQSTDYESMIDSVFHTCRNIEKWRVKQLESR